MALRLCASCSRHVRASDSTCPFCQSTESAALPSPISRATRAAMVFGGATLVVAGMACSSTSTPEDGGTPVPAYGAPALDSSVQDSGVDTGPVALYGGPPVRDAGADSPSAAYGGPPVDAGTD